MTGRRDDLAERLEHFVSEAPFDPYSREVMTPAQERYFQAPAWKLMWWRFKKHKLALWSLYFLVLLYLMTLFV